MGKQIRRNPNAMRKCNFQKIVLLTNRFGGILLTFLILNALGQSEYSQVIIDSLCHSDL
jgi:hypothetical protein